MNNEKLKIYNMRKHPLVGADRVSALTNDTKTNAAKTNEGLTNDTKMI